MAQVAPYDDEYVAPVDTPQQEEYVAPEQDTKEPEEEYNSDDEEEGGGGCCGGGKKKSHAATPENSVTKLTMRRLREVEENFDKLFKFEKVVLDKGAFKASQSLNKQLIKTIKRAKGILKTYRKAKKDFDKEYRLLETEMAKPVPDKNKMAKIQKGKTLCEDGLETQRSLLHAVVLTELDQLKGECHMRTIQGLLHAVTNVKTVWKDPAIEVKELQDAEGRAREKANKAASGLAEKLIAAEGKEGEFILTFVERIKALDENEIKAMLKTHKPVAKDFFEKKSMLHWCLAADGGTGEDANSASNSAANETFRVNILKRLVKAKADVNLVDEAGMAPIHNASMAMFGHPLDGPAGCPFIKTLLDAKALPNVVTPNGCTPLHLAVNCQRPLALQYIWSRGGNPNHACPLGSLEELAQGDETTLLAITQSRTGVYEMLGKQ